jgi:hypothetical protein
MRLKSNLFSTISSSKLVLFLSALLVLAGCGGSDDSNNVGYFKFYNSSKNSPDIILTLDQDLESDDDDDADNYEVSFNGAAYNEALSKFEIDTNSYFYEMAWQDEDSSDRDDLEIVAQGQIAVTTEAIQLLVLTDDITSPQVESYSIEVLDDDEDDEDDEEDLFNLRVLNLHPESVGVDFYMSGSDESFNEAILVGQYNTSSIKLLLTFAS